ncbi:MAG: hypothetical protein KC910_09360, partial [Candidatus Eremiobacteraeota bacterium]|nr:hypothetical protein [Candidatus Eremiobacteraeota bacterium]
MPFGRLAGWAGAVWAAGLGGLARPALAGQVPGHFQLEDRPGSAGPVRQCGLPNRPGPGGLARRERA